MEDYKIEITIEGPWGCRFREKYIFAENDTCADEQAKDYLSMIESTELREFEKAFVEDVILMS